MDKQTPSRPQRVASKKPQPLDSEQKFEEQELAKPTPFDTNKYAPKDKIGSPTIGRDPKRVERVGLGGLTTITSYGN